jgi:hypothetical protein
MDPGNQYERGAKMISDIDFDPARGIDPAGASDSMNDGTLSVADDEAPKLTKRKYKPYRPRTAPPGRRALRIGQDFPNDRQGPAYTGKPQVPAITPSSPEQLPRRIVYTVLCGVMSPKKAKMLAGYSGGAVLPDIYDPRTVAQIRERLQSVAGVSLADQIAFYAEQRDATQNTPAERISAAKQIDKDLGYEAPAKVEVNEKREIAIAVSVFNEVRGKLGMSARELAQIAEAQVIESKPFNGDDLV